MSNLTIFKADSRNNNSDVNFQSRIYGVDDEDYESLYYTVVLSEKMPHLFSIMENLGFEPLNAQVMATAKIHHVMHGLDLYSQMVLKKISETYVDWDIIKREKGSNTAADNRSVLTAGVYYKKFNHYRTELLIMDGYGVSSGQNKVEKNTNIEQTQWDDLFIDFRAELYPKQDNIDIDLMKYVFKNNRDWLYGDITKTKTEDVDNPSYEYRVHYPLNINAVYPLLKENLKEGDNPYHCLYVLIEREPVRKNGKYTTYNKNNEDVTLSGRGNMSSVRQIIINVNADNSNAAATDRPIVFFYDGPEKGHPEHVDENGKHVRDSQPVILNLYANFRGILFAPNSPVAINGNNYNFEGFVVAKEFVQMMQQSDYQEVTAVKNETDENGTDEGETFYVKPGTLIKYENEDTQPHEVFNITCEVPKTTTITDFDSEKTVVNSFKQDGGFTTKSGYVNEANLSATYDKYQYPYKVKTNDGKTFFLNSLNSIKDTADKAEDTTIFDENNEPSYYISEDAIYYKVSEESVSKTGDFTSSKQVTKKTIDGKDYITTKFIDSANSNNDNSLFIDNHGNVQYKGVITPNVELAENYRPDGIDPKTGQYTRPTEDGEFEQFNDDFTFVGNPFNLASKKYNSFKNVGLVSYGYLDSTEKGETGSSDEGDFTYNSEDVFYMTARSKHIE